MLICGIDKSTGHQRPFVVSEDGEIVTTADSVYSQVLISLDLTKTFTYADAGTVDERITEIQYASVSVGTGFTETYQYSGSPGAYRVTSFSRTAN